MKSMIAAVILCSALYADDPMNDRASSFERIAETVQPRNIQILLEKDAHEVLLEVKGPYYIFNPHDGVRVAAGLLGKRFMIRERENGLKWGEEFPGIHQIYIAPRSSETSIFINGIQYAGAVAIYGVNGAINIVNDLDIEAYVKSILTSQFPTPLESEVMSSLAILARTNAYYQSIKNQDSFWHIAAAENNYLGSALVVPNSPVERAVDSTKNLILVHPHDGINTPFATCWTEHSAGKTARYDAIFRVDADAVERGVDAPHAALARQDSKWTYLITKKALAQALDLDQIKSLEVFLDQPSGKVYGLRVKDSSETLDVDFFTLQNKLGPRHILSSDFTISTKEDAVLFTGYGRGHGVGLCLYSASALAQNGDNAVKILAKFFPETYLYNLNTLPDGTIK